MSTKAKLIATEKALRISPLCRTLLDKDGALILNIANGQLYVLNRCGARVWELLLSTARGVSQGDTRGELARGFGPPFESMETRTREFLRTLQSVQLISTADAELPPSLVWNHSGAGMAENGHVPTQRYRESPKLQAPCRQVVVIDAEFGCSKKNCISAFLGLAIVDLLLRIGGFKTVYSLLKRWPASERTHVENGAVERTFRAVSRACIYYPKRVLCLQRAATTTFLLRMNGVAATMVIGIRRIPFGGHSWVEVDGNAVNEGLDVLRSYRVIDRV